MYPLEAESVRTCGNFLTGTLREMSVNVKASKWPRAAGEAIHFRVKLEKKDQGTQQAFL